MTKYSQQYDNKLLQGILDHMANELKSEFGFSTLDEEDTLDIISLFVDNPDKYETAYLHSIETEDTEVVPAKEMSNVEILKNLVDYNRYDG